MTSSPSEYPTKDLEHKSDPSSIELVTDRLHLRPVTSEDFDELKSVLSDPAVMEFSDGVLTDEKIAEWVKKQQAQLDETGMPVFAIRGKEGNQLIGYCGLFTCEIDGVKEVEVGYRLATSAWGNGYATEAAQAVMDYAGKHGIERVVAMIDPGNVASVKVAERLGMTFEKPFMLPEYDHPDHLYVKTVVAEVV